MAAVRLTPNPVIAHLWAASRPPSYTQSMLIRCLDRVLHAQQSAVVQCGGEL